MSTTSSNSFTDKNGRKWIEVVRRLWTSPLALRFWDPVTQSVIRGMRAILQDAVPRGHIRKAISSPSGTMIFKPKPGEPFQYFQQSSQINSESDVDGGTIPEAGEIGSPPYREESLLAAEHDKEEFLPITYRVPHPWSGEGPFLSSWDTKTEPGIAPLESIRGFPLFSSPLRTLPSGFTSLRGEIRNLDTNNPASWALVEVTYPNTSDSWFGMADERGVFQVPVAFPSPDLPPIVSSPPAGIPLNAQHWDMELTVFHDTGLEYISGFQAPEFSSIASQGQVEILQQSDAPGSSVNALSFQLSFSPSQSIHSQGSSLLWIQNVAHSPP